MNETRLISPDIKKNADIMQSYMMTEARYDLSKTEMQILIILIAAAQQDLQEMIADGIRKGTSEYQVPKYDRNILVRFSLKDLPFDMNRNELQLLKAARKLVGRSIETRCQLGWEVITIISAVKYTRKDRSVTLTVLPEIWEKIMDIRLGYSEYELLTALGLDTKYGVRFYMMVSGDTRPKEFTIEELKAQFKLDKQYSQPTDFFKRVIIPAKKDLDENAPMTFDVKKVKKNGGKEVTGFIITPKRNMKKRDPSLEEKKLLHGRVQIGMALDSEELAWLRQRLCFTDVELNSNFGTFNTAKKVYGAGLLNEMISIYEYMLRNGLGTQKGYFIKSLKENSKPKEITSTLASVNDSAPATGRLQQGILF